MAPRAPIPTRFAARAFRTPHEQFQIVRISPKLFDALLTFALPFPRHPHCPIPDTGSREAHISETWGLGALHKPHSKIMAVSRPILRSMWLILAFVTPHSTQEQAIHLWVCKCPSCIGPLKEGGRCSSVSNTLARQVGAVRWVGYQVSTVRALVLRPTQRPLCVLSFLFSLLTTPPSLHSVPRQRMRTDILISLPPCSILHFSPCLSPSSTYLVLISSVLSPPSTSPSTSLPSPTVSLSPSLHPFLPLPSLSLVCSFVS